MEYLNYAQHYFDKDMAISFFLVSLAGLVIVMGIIFMTARIWQEIDPEEIPEEDQEELDDPDEISEGNLRRVSRHVSERNTIGDDLESDEDDIYDDSDDFYDEEDSEVKTNRRNLACINRSISRVSESDIGMEDGEERHRETIGRRVGRTNERIRDLNIDDSQSLNRGRSERDGVSSGRSRNMDQGGRSVSRSRGRNISRSRGMNQSRRLPRRRTPDFRYRRPLEFIESFYELVFASTSILLLLSLYYIIGDRINVDSINAMWNDYKDWLLLLFLLLSMLLNRILDRILVPMRHIDAKQRASMRLVSSIYVVFILLYIRFIYESYNYESLIIYFVMLVVGRLFYFDVTWEGFKSDITGIVKNFPFVILMGAYTAGVTWYGFHSGFLLKANGVLVSTLIAHLFMDVCIVLFDKSRIWKLFLR
ncbi:hypothetical protein [Oribacterium sp. FC2011]|uniref:hypothetical protein n=1 Tax=Oribacterium sp. FC2011 TaxID=1408311 RepID=UPI0006791166|nr:hypothetical protein [Oribacterium sp. FC2011]